MKGFLPLALLGCCIGAVFAEAEPSPAVLGGYLPPVKEVCVPQTHTQYVKQTHTSQVVQPVYVTQTNTRYEDRVQTNRVEHTQTRERVAYSQVQVPVVRNVQKVVYVTRTNVQIVPYHPPAQTRVFTSTIDKHQTKVQHRYVTLTNTRVQQIYVTKTQFNTNFVDKTNVQTQINTSIRRLQDIQRYVTQTHHATRVQNIPSPAQTSFRQKEVVQSRQVQSYITPYPITSTQVAQREVVRTQVQNVVSTQQAYATREIVNTQVAYVTRTNVNTITSTHYRNKVEERTQVVERVVTQTQVVPQTRVIHSVVTQVNNKYVTQTQRRQVVDTQTVRGANQVRESLVTSVVNRVRTVTNDVRGYDVTITNTVTQTCQQTGYNYDRPAVTANLYG